MSDTIRCPDCGHQNPPGATECANCGFPLGAEAPQAGRGAPAGTASPAPNAAPPSAEPPAMPYIPRPIRRPPRTRPNAQAATLWLIFGSFCAIVVIGVAIKSNVDRANEPIEGSSPV